MRRLEHALFPAVRLEHALLPRLRLEHVLFFPRPRLGTEEFQPVEEAPAAIELGRGGFGITCALGFFRPRRRAAANLLGGDAANIRGRDVERRAMLTRAAGIARRRRRRQRPIEDRIGMLRIGHGARRRPRSARGVLRRNGRTLLRRLRRRTDVAARSRARRLDLVPAARLGWAGLARAGFGWLVPLARLTELRRRHLAGGLHELTRRFGLDFTDRLLERETLAGDVGLLECRRHAAQLREQRLARAFVNRAAVLATVFFERGDGAGDQRIIVGHRTYSFRLLDCT